MWTAYALSVGGDQLAAVALSVLVFNRTGSPAWAALTYALTFLPDLLGGPLLAGLADRFPRRTVMITADVARAVLVGLMAIPGQSLAVLVVLLFVVQLLSSPFNAARGAVVPALLRGDRYVAGMTIMRMTYQLGSVAGFAVGGAVLAGLGTSRALLIDALTFVASALLVAFGVQAHRPAARRRAATVLVGDVERRLATGGAQSEAAVADRAGLRVRGVRDPGGPRRRVRGAGAREFGRGRRADGGQSGGHGAGHAGVAATAAVAAAEPVRAARRRHLRDADPDLVGARPWRSRWCCGSSAASGPRTT